MPAYYEIHWLPEGRVEEFYGSRGNYYEFSETDRLDLNPTLIWCHGCRQITEGEYLPTLEEIDQQIRDLNDPASQFYKWTRSGLVDKITGQGERLLQERLAELRRRRQWRESRQSPPKCIHCGTTEVVLLPLGERVSNPGGAGEILVECVGMCSTSFNEWFFTPEGDRIPRDTRPTYWHHPAFDDPERSREISEFMESLFDDGEQRA